ncbi:hypothetical protein [Ornithinimicrobium sp. LYQ103]|uniref:hypothetical protein n=1 Tax=Ornithinimicrobium sp. LYQ103 TaxID=3378796 RepID=UPI003854BAC5
MQEQEMIGLEWPDQLPLDEGLLVVPPQADEEPEDEAQTEVSQALRYMVDHALRFSRVKGFDDLLEHLAGFRQYRPTTPCSFSCSCPMSDACCWPTAGSRTTAAGSALGLLQRSCPVSG